MLSDGEHAMKYFYYVFFILNILYTHIYTNVGVGLDLFSTEGPDIRPFSYIPQFGIGSYIYINEWADVDLGFNLHPVRFETNYDHKPMQRIYNS